MQGQARARLVPSRQELGWWAGEQAAEDGRHRPQRGWRSAPGHPGQPHGNTAYFLRQDRRVDTYVKSPNVSSVNN